MDVIELIKKEGLRRVRSGRKIYNCNVFYIIIMEKDQGLALHFLLKKMEKFSLGAFEK
ncbi:MAG: hypothetical protein KJ968_04165 [Nanoarchaeota archaeon]|nr:hypothetical protein [Nanoarchaeota archaeon]